MPPRQCTLIASALNTFPTRRHALRRITTPPGLLSDRPNTSTSRACYRVSRSVIPTLYPYVFRTRDPSRPVRDACAAACITPKRVLRHYQGTSFIDSHWEAYIGNVRAATNKLPFNVHPSGYRAGKPRQTSCTDLALQNIKDPAQISSTGTVHGTMSPRFFNCGVNLRKLSRIWIVRRAKHAANYTVAVEKVTQSEADVKDNAAKQTLTFLHKQPHKPQRTAKGCIVNVNRSVGFDSKASPMVREACFSLGVKDAKTIHILGSKWSKKSNNTAIWVTHSRSIAPYSTISYMKGRLATGFTLQTGHSLSPGLSGELLSQNVAGNDAENDSADNPDYGEASSSNSNNSTLCDFDNSLRNDTPKIPSSIHPSGTLNINNDIPDPERPKDRDDSERESDLETTDVETEHIPLKFQIPPTTLRAAMSASENSAGSFYSQALYRGPNDELISIHYCHTMEIAERVAKYFLEVKLLGFDIEWKPFAPPHSIKENAPLIQLACEDRIALFHIAMYQGTTASELLPPSLKTIIESRDIWKVGVAIKGDFSRLEKYLGVKPRGVFELSRLHNLVIYSGIDSKRAGSKKLSSLAKQVQQHLQLPLFKGVVRESDWSQRLKFDQMTYAATDAYASFRIFDVLESKRRKLRPIPSRPLLCDFDSTPQLKTTPRAKTTRKGLAIPKKDGVRAEISQLNDDNDSVQYKTAADELMDSHELENSSEYASSSLTQEQRNDPTADYSPRNHRTGRLKQISQQDDQQTEPSEDRRSRRVGRMDFSALASPNPECSTAPEIPWNEDMRSDSNDSTDPTAQAPEWTAANLWAQEYSFSSIPSASSPSPTRSSIRATIPHLRAYHMWRHQNMSMSGIAKHLRDPPLAEGTVASYILQAVTLEKLEYRSEDLKDVLRGLPRTLRVGRWRWLVEKVGSI